MTATVPLSPSTPSYSTSVLSGLPVLGGDWSAAADALSWVRGRGGVLIPAYDPAYTLLPADTGVATAIDFKFRVFHRLPAFARVWVIGARRSSAIISPGVGLQTLTVTAPAGTGAAGSYTVISDVIGGEDTRMVYVERLAAQVSGEQDITLRLALNADTTKTSSYDVYSIACFELPRFTLLAADSAVDIDTCRALQPIYDGAVGQSVGGVGDALVAAEAQAARPGLHVWARPDTYAVSTTAAAFTDFFAGRPPALAHRRTTTTKEVRVRVRARVDAGTVGEVRVTSRLGATTTVSVSATAFGYVGGTTVAIDVEDVFTTDGRGGGVSEAVRWEWRRVSGAGLLLVSGLYLIDG